MPHAFGVGISKFTYAWCLAIKTRPRIMFPYLLAKHLEKVEWLPGK
ncbi:MAG: hypothetical protein QW604_00740 [Fervidicoccaceae archaeon]